MLMSGHKGSTIGTVLAITVLVVLFAIPVGAIAQESSEPTPTVVSIESASIDELADAVALRLSSETFQVLGSVTVTDMPAVSLETSLTISPDATITVDPWHLPGLSDDWPLALLSIVVIAGGVAFGASLTG